VFDIIVIVCGSASVVANGATWHKKTPGGDPGAHGRTVWLPSPTHALRLYKYKNTGHRCHPSCLCERLAAVLRASTAKTVKHVISGASRAIIENLLAENNKNHSGPSRTPPDRDIPNAQIVIFWGSLCESFTT
jgi:hypothetical protein